MPSDESALAVRAVHDPTAFGELYDCFFKRVFNFARYRCNDDATADELTARIFERVLTRLEQYQPEKGPFAPWLFALARNVVNDYWRKENRFRRIPLDFLRTAPAARPDPETRLIASVEQGKLLAALERLDERERDLLSLKFAARLTNRRIAAVTGLSASNVGVILYRAISKLRYQLMDDDDD